MSELTDFDLGLDASVNPQPAEVDAVVSGEAVTHGTSWWHTTPCVTCGHTFRRGDRVRVDAAARRVGHLDSRLGCLTPAASVAEAGLDSAEFSAGMLAAWPIRDGVSVIRTDHVPTLLDPPAHGFRRSSCLFCAHTFRPGEIVVLCPCTPFRPRCESAVHRDPAQGLTCWESWHPDSRVKVCPVMLSYTAER